MTVIKLNNLIKKYNIPEDVVLQCDSGWECGEVDMNGIYSNKQENRIIFTPDIRDYHYWHNKEGWIILEG